MVTYPAVQASNSRIPSELPPGLVAVLVGATSGIGEYTLRALAKHAKQPRIYFIGRSQQAGELIQAECKALNPDGEFTFMKADVSLMRNVDTICQEIKQKEQAINLLCVSQGAFYNTDVTDEGLRAPVALQYYSRLRFIANLLPVLQRAQGLRRIVSIFAGGKEGPVNVPDMRLEKGTNPLAYQGHLASMMTFSLEVLAAKAPGVAFVHTFPGPVKSNIARDKNMVNLVLRSIFYFLGPFINMPEEESGERHVFVATSGRYPAAKGGNDAEAVALEKGVTVSKGTDGVEGSGVYTTDAQCKPSDQKVDAMLAKMRSEGVPGKVWEHTEAEFKRMVGTTAI